MIIYQASKSQFLQHALRDDIEDIVSRQFRSVMGHGVGPSEIQSWKYSLLEMAKVLQDEEIPADAGVAIEYQLPQSSKRIDFVITGQDAAAQTKVVIVELKQWSDSRRSEKDAIVWARRGGRTGESEGTHPSYQAWSYAAYLEDFNAAVQEGAMALQPCAYLHNHPRNGEIDHPHYREHLARAPLFLARERAKLQAFIREHVHHGDRRGALYAIENGRIRPSKMLIDSVAGLLQGKPEFVLIDDQKVVHETILEVDSRAAHRKQVVIVQGGPGTGKSVIAINLLGALIGRGRNARYVSKNAAPRAVYEARLAGTFTKTRISNLFSGSGAFVNDAADTAGWAVAGATPFTWTKMVASNYGGTRNGLVVHWPAGFKPRGELRTQWHHVIDIAPTILEAAKLPEPSVVNGIAQSPIDGVSMLYTFGDADAKDRRLTQYFELYGNRAIYHDGWLAGTVHGAPWETGKPRATLENDKWELYDTRTDFSLADDLAGKLPDKLKEMQDLFLKEAVKYNVLPLDDRKLERFNAALVGRPDLMAGRTSLTVYEGMTGLSENVFINTKNRSHTVTAELQIPKAGARGVILAQAGRFGGWSLYLKDGKPTYTYNFLGLKRFTIAGKQGVPVGKATLRYEFAYDGGGIGNGGTGTLFVNGRKVAEGRIEHTQGMIFSVEEGTDVGRDGETPVVENYGIAAPYEFTGKIEKVTIDLKDAGKPGEALPSRVPAGPARQAATAG